MNILTLTNFGRMITVVNKYKHSPTLNDFYIGRGTDIGNPFTHITSKATKAEFIVKDRETAIIEYEKWILDKIEKKDKKVCDTLNFIFKQAQKGELNLVCYCSPKSCHGDVIKKIIEEKLGLPPENNKVEN